MILSRSTCVWCMICMIILRNIFYLLYHCFDEIICHQCPKLQGTTWNLYVSIIGPFHYFCLKLLCISQTDLLIPLAFKSSHTLSLHTLTAKLTASPCTLFMSMYTWRRSCFLYLWIITPIYRARLDFGLAGWPDRKIRGGLGGRGFQEVQYMGMGRINGLTLTLAIFLLHAPTWPLFLI